MTIAVPTPLPLAISGPEIFIALVFVVGGLVKHLLEKSAGRNADPTPSQRTPPLVPPRPPALPPRPLATPEEERARRLMEALGQPGRAAPPLPPAPPRPPPAPAPPVSRPAPPPLPPPPQPSAPPASLPPSRRTVPQPLPETAPASSRRPLPFRPSPPPPVPVPATSLRGLLQTASRDELRRAILLREVLGPPRALSEPGAASM